MPNSRNKSGDTIAYPAVEMEFNPVANMVEYLFSPADIGKDIEKAAKELALQVINKLEMVGILAVEMFLTKEGEILVNEIAPRPHNSGHHTIEGNYSSQFATHLRAILNLPPGDTNARCSSAMVNILGEPGYIGPAIFDGIEKVIAMPGVYVHLYGKTHTKAYRKMGHVTVTGTNSDEVKYKAKEVKQLLKCIS
jgi:5-(carboxyamino)imidazole ribonucleotide synthase